MDAAWAEAAARALAPAALLRVASDHREYFGLIDDTLSKEHLLEKVPADEAGDWSTGTSYEVKFLRAGRPVYRAVFCRRASDAASRGSAETPASRAASSARSLASNGLRNLRK